MGRYITHLFGHFVLLIPTYASDKARICVAFATETTCFPALRYGAGLRFLRILTCVLLLDIFFELLFADQSETHLVHI